MKLQEIEHILQNAVGIKLLKQLAFHYNANPQNIGELYEFIQNGSIRQQRNASHLIIQLLPKQKTIIEKKIKVILNKLAQTDDESVIRNCLRILGEVTIPERNRMTTYDKCLALMAREDSPAAIKAFAMTVVFNITLAHVELAGELDAIINEKMTFERPSFVVRARKYLNYYMQHKNKFPFLNQTH